MAKDLQTHIKILATFRDNPGISANEAVKLAGVGNLRQAAQMRSRGQLIAVGFAVVDYGCSKKPLLYSITDKGLLVIETYTKLLAKMVVAPPSVLLRRSMQFSYTPRPRAPGETPGVLIVPMLQPRYVPPRWESAR